MFNILNNSNMFHMAKKGHWATKLHPLSLCDATHAKNDFENCGRPSKMLDVLAYLFSRGAADYVGDARAVWNLHADSVLPAVSILYFPNGLEFLHAISPAGESPGPGGRGVSVAGRTRWSRG